MHHFIMAAQAAFGAGDADGSGVIEYAEIKAALAACGFNMTETSMNILLRRMMAPSGLYADSGAGLTFPQFVDLCAYCALARRVFSWHDTDLDATATITLDDFMGMVMVIKP
ncbi:penta-EF hand domain-containing protein 1, partial [Thecamonas trahens ATCC 50062]